MSCPKCGDPSIRGTPKGYCGYCIVTVESDRKAYWDRDPTRHNEVLPPQTDLRSIVAAVADANGQAIWEADEGLRRQLQQRSVSQLPNVLNP